MLVLEACSLIGPGPSSNEVCSRTAVDASPIFRGAWALRIKNRLTQVGIEWRSVGSKTKARQGTSLLTKQVRIFGSGRL